MPVMENDLLEEADRNNIKVFRFPLPEAGSLSLRTNAGDVIGLDSSDRFTHGELQAHLGHELGHCMYGGFYCRYSPCDTIEYHEARADRWYIKHAIPREKLFSMLRQGYDAWEIAEKLDTTEDYVRKAYYFYMDMDA